MATGKVLAAIDVGSNSIKLLVARRDPQDPEHVVRGPAREGDGAPRAARRSPTGALSEEAMEDGLDCLARYAALARGGGRRVDRGGRDVRGARGVERRRVRPARAPRNRHPPRRDLGGGGGASHHARRPRGPAAVVRPASRARHRRRLDGGRRRDGREGAPRREPRPRRRAAHGPPRLDGPALGARREGAAQGGPVAAEAAREARREGANQDRRRDVGHDPRGRRRSRPTSRAARARAAATSRSRAGT